MTSGLVLRQISSKKERTVWHLQYTDWPDHGCPDDLHGFLGIITSLYILLSIHNSRGQAGYTWSVVGNICTLTPCHFDLSPVSEIYIPV